MEIYIGKDKGRWLKGTRVKKVMSQPRDTHRDGALGTIVGALGPSTASQRAEFIIALDEEGIDGIDGDVEYIYWVEWDDIPGLPVAIIDNRIEPVED